LLDEVLKAHLFFHLPRYSNRAHYGFVSYTFMTFLLSGLQNQKSCTLILKIWIQKT